MSSFQSILDIIPIVQQAKQPGKALQIRGYAKVSKSDVNGAPEIGDYLLRLLPENNGYTQLVRESLIALQSRKLARPEWADADLWIAAMHDKETSWANTLSGNTKQRNFAQELIPLADVPNGAYYAEDPETFILLDIERLNYTPPPPEGKAPLTQVKDYIQKNSPAGRFIKQLNLRIGSFQDLQAVDAPTKLDAAV